MVAKPKTTILRVNIHGEEFRETKLHVKIHRISSRTIHNCPFLKFSLLVSFQQVYHLIENYKGAKKEKKKKKLNGK